MSVANFILARLAEDEAAARAAAAGSRGRWRITPSASGRPTLHTEGMGWEPLANEGIWQCNDPDDDCEEYRAQDERDVTHITRQDPARVLRQVEAMRRVVRRSAEPTAVVPTSEVSPFGELTLAGGRIYENCGRGAVDVTDAWRDWLQRHEQPADMETLRDLASVWSDHPDYRTEWDRERT